MKKNIILFFGFFLLSSNSNAQYFEFRGVAPFGIEMYNTLDTMKLTLKYNFKDLDNDGDLDLIHFGLDLGKLDTTALTFTSSLSYYIEMQENVGTKWQPEFSGRKNCFDSISFLKGESYMIPTVGDLNKDGMMDLLINSEVDPYFLQFPLFNIQNPDGSFSVSRSEQWGLDPFTPNSAFIPELIDLDRDNDFDILMGGYISYNPDGSENVPTILYAKNTGTPTDPSFLGWFENPYGLVPPDTISRYFFGGDIDLDGDVDLIGIGNGLEYYENKPGSNGKPAFSGYIPTPFGLPEIMEEENLLFPSLADVDGDGDIDIFLLIELDNNLSLDFYENTLCDPNQENIEFTICEGESYFIGDQEFYESGIFQVETALPTGCKTLTTLTLEVLPESTEFIEETLCFGESYFIGDQEFTVSGHYELSFMSQSGCDSVIIADLEFIELNVEVEATGPALTAFYQDNYSYQWFDCNTNADIENATSFVFEAPYSGSFAVRIEDNSGCVEESACFDVIASTVWREQMNRQISIFPNPTNGIIQLTNRTEEDILYVELMDLSGKSIWKLWGTEVNYMDLADQTQGIYYIRLGLESGELVKEIVLIK